MLNPWVPGSILGAKCVRKSLVNALDNEGWTPLMPGAQNSQR